MIYYVATALVLSAGGMFAAWEAGVWKGLHQRIRPDLIVGASAGAWNGWLIAGGANPDELIGEWLDPVSARILRPAWRASALHQKARQIYSRWRPRLPFGLTMVEIPRFRPRLVRAADIRVEHLTATCSIPLVLPPVKIGGAWFVDGGVLGALPLWAAEEMGATHAIALNAWPYRFWGRVLKRRIPRTTIPTTLIEPSEPLGSLGDAAIWRAANIQRWIALGERDGKRAAGSITM